MAKDVMKKKPADDEMQKHASAKMSVLNELRNMAMGMMGDKVKAGLPKEMHGVEVMAPDKEGLEKGLDLAKHVLPGADEDGSSSGHGQPDDSHAMEADAHDAPGHMENPGEDEDDMDDDELDSMLAELQAKKAARLARK